MNAVTKIEVLKAARAKIEKPESWTQNQLARIGPRVLMAPDEIKDRAAEVTCFCAEGAIRASAPNPHVIEELLVEMEAEIPGNLRFDSGGGNIQVYKFNDSANHAEVLALFDRTIARLEKVTP